MRVRKQTDDGDYQFGNSQADFLIDTAEEVAQRVETRLLLMRGEWFLDKTDGTPYSTEILGAHTKPFYDLAIQERVLRTEGVSSIIEYSSDLNGASRALTVSMRIETVFGPIPVQGVF